jgi:hypothetical protein
MKKIKNKQKLPDFFKPLFWSTNFNALDLDLNKKIIILTTVNYGDLNHWRWVKNYYGKDQLRNVLKQAPATEFKPRAGKLAEILFNFKLNYAPRGVN